MISLFALFSPKRPRYQAYINSLAWKIKAKWKKFRNPNCSTCNRPYNLQVHHRTYERLGQERDEDLTVLCERCHKIFHKFYKYDSKRHCFVPIDNRNQIGRRKIK